MSAALFQALANADTTLEDIRRKARQEERRAIITLLDELKDDARSETAKRALRLAVKWIKVTGV